MPERLWGRNTDGLQSVGPSAPEGSAVSAAASPVALLAPAGPTARRSRASGRACAPPTDPRSRRRGVPRGSARSSRADGTTIESERSGRAPPRDPPSPPRRPPWPCSLERRTALRLVGE